MAPEAAVAEWPFVVISPSYRRAGNVEVRKLLPETVLAVHESEFEDYKKLDGGPLLKVPDALKGNMAKVRNFILTEGYRRSPWVVTLDDDVREIRYMEELNPVPYRSPERICSFLTNGFVMAEDVGAKLWGINLQADRKFYREFSPFTFLSPVLGTFSCHLKNPLRYDERLSFNEDYDFSLQHLHRYRRILRFSKWNYMAGHLTEPGGCGSYRTLEREKEEAEIMVSKWGPQIVSYNFKKSTNPRIRVPLRGM